MKINITAEDAYLLVHGENYDLQMVASTLIDTNPNIRRAANRYEKRQAELCEETDATPCEKDV